MKVFLAIGLFVFLLWAVLSTFGIVYGGAKREQKVLLEKKLLEHELKTIYEAALIYKMSHGSYPSSITELVSVNRDKINLEVLSSYKINSDARDLEPLIEYTGANKGLAGYKVLENGIVTRLNVTSSVNK